MTRKVEGAATIRRLPIPITLPAGRVGRGHLVPDLSSDAPRGFIRVPGGRRVRYGMVAFVGAAVAPADLLHRWEHEVGPLANRKLAMRRLQGYLAEIARLKLGNIVEVDYSFGGIPRLKKLRDTPPSEVTPLPE